MSRLEPMRLTDLLQTPASASNRLSRKPSLIPKISQSKRSISVDASARKGYTLKQPADIMRPSTMIRSTSMSSLVTPMRISSACQRTPRSLSRNRSPSSDRNRFYMDRNDRRPIADKKWISTQSALFIEFMASHEELRSMIPKKGPLRIMSINDFIKTLKYFVGQISNDRVVLTQANYIDETINLAKKLAYPGVITKSVMRTLNTLHSFPNGLAFLVFLMNIVKSQMHMDEQDVPSSIHGMKLGFNIKSFALWSEEKTEQLEKEEALHIQQILSLAECDTAQVATLNEEVARLKLELDSNVKANKILRDKLNELSSTVHKYDQDNNKLSDLQKEIYKIQGEEECVLSRIIECENDLSEVNKNMIELRAIIKAQVVSVHQKERIELDIQKMKNKQDQNAQLSEDFNKILFQNNMKLCSLSKEINELCITFNKKIMRNNIQLKAFDCARYVQDLDVNKMTDPVAVNGLLEIEKALEEISKIANAEYKKRSEGNIKIRHRVDIIQNTKQELKIQNKNITDSITKLKACIEQNKVTYNENLKRHRDSIHIVDLYIEEADAQAEILQAKLENEKEKINILKTERDVKNKALLSYIQEKKEIVLNKDRIFKNTIQEQIQGTLLLKEQMLEIIAAEKEITI